MKRLRLVPVLGLSLLASMLFGCATLVTHVAMPFLYEKAVVPDDRVERDLSYREAPAADPDKLRFDWYRPEGRDWRTVVFVHGGGWRSGDRALTVGGADVYRNIGRFFASRGVAAAVISYRLQPEVPWSEQVADVTHAVRSVREKVAAEGGDPNGLFLAGHSAGAHLSAYAGLDRARLEAQGVPASSVCGIIPVSGAALDLNDAPSWALGQSESYYESRFGSEEPPEVWRRRASVSPLVAAGAPPALILYAGGESSVLIRQAHALHERYQAVGAASRLVEVPGEDHSRIVLTLSREDKTAGPAMLDFVRGASCAPSEGGSLPGG